MIHQDRSFGNVRTLKIQQHSMAVETFQTIQQLLCDALRIMFPDGGNIIQQEQSMGRKPLG